MTEAAAGPHVAAQIIGLLAARGQTAAVAESLTGGLLAAAFTSVPGASAVFRGGVVAYASDLKAAILGVPADLLERRGAVDPEVAAEMAAGVRSRLAATVGAATTGVAGPIRPTGSPWAPSTSRSASDPALRRRARRCGRWRCEAPGTRSGGRP